MDEKEKEKQEKIFDILKFEKLCESMVKNQTATQNKILKQQNKDINHSNFNVKVNNSLNFKTAIAVGKSFHWRNSIHSIRTTSSPSAKTFKASTIY